MKDMHLPGALEEGGGSIAEGRVRGGQASLVQQVVWSLFHDTHKLICNFEHSRDALETFEK